MLARPKKKELTQEQRQAITSASRKQTGTMSSPKTYDPNFPVFEIPVNKKLLVYIPNHTVSTEDGGVELRMDKFAAHQVKMGKAYSSVRCTGEVVNEALKLDGTCPLCDATQTCWDLYNKQYAEICNSRGFKVDSQEAEEQLKETRKELIKDMVIGRAELWMTFPIVVIECEEGKTVPKLDAEGKIQGTPMFYSVREQTYIDKWMTAFDALEDSEGDVDRNPAGRWAVLNFTYTPKSGQHNKRDSARNLKVSFVERDNLKEWAEYYDKLTEEWTPEKAQDVLVLNAVRDMDEMIETAEQLIKPTRERLEVYNLSATGSIGGTQVAPAVGNADSALANFGATPVEQTGTQAENAQAPQTPQTPPVGEMPSNVGVQ